MVDARETLLHEIKDRLVYYATRVRVEQGRLSDGAEDFYRGLLNILLGCDLKNMNHERDNFPAIDLGDDDSRICVQVSSTGTRTKVRHTLKEFFENELQERFVRLIVLVAGDAERFDTEPKNDVGFDFQTKRDIWDTGKLIREIGKLEDEVLERIAAYLRRRVSLPSRAPLLDLLMGSAMPDDRFVGREAELRRIGEELEKNHVAFLSGLGGMGKTALALRYGDGYRVTGWRFVYFVRFKNSFGQTMLENIAPFIPDFSREGLNEQQITDGGLKILRRGDPNDLLILDNVDEFESFEKMKRDPVFRGLCALPMKLLVTTRMQVRGGIELEPLSNPELYRIFRQNGVDLPTGMMDKLIAAVNAHTMTVDLMARTMDESWETVTAEMILEAMENSSLPEEDYPEVYTDHNQDPQQRQIYAHLRSLFNLTNIPEDGKQALRCATLLPQNGMDPAIFLQALPKGPANAIRLLEKQGWVQRENHLLTIHPVVRMVCKRELEPTEETCGTFMDGVWGWYDQKNYDHVRFRQLAELLTNAAETLGDPNGWYIGQAGYLWSKLGEYRQALQCKLRDVELKEQNQPDSDELATAYNNLGRTYDDLGDYTKALMYKEKALAIRERVLPIEHPDLASSYNNVGATYGAHGDYAMALEYEHKALAIREKVLIPGHPSLATSYINLGNTYHALGNYAKALEYHQKALTIQKNILPPEHPYLAQSYDNVGMTYGALGDYAKALEYQQKALAIREKVLPPEHPDLATSYNNVGYIYGNMGNREKNLEYGLKAFAIREKVLPPTHPKLALSCNNLACTYFVMGNYDTALKLMRRAADIADQSLPEGHRDRVNYRRWAEDIEREIGERRTSE